MAKDIRPEEDSSELKKTQSKSQPNQNARMSEAEERLKYGKNK